MIEIIKPGTKQKITCYDCGCFFSFEESDVETEDRTTPFGYQPKSRFVRCPQCETIVHIDPRPRTPNYKSSVTLPEV